MRLHLIRAPILVSTKWDKLLSKDENTTKQSGVENHNALNISQRYHSYLGQIYNKVYADASRSGKELVFSIAIKV